MSRKWKGWNEYEERPGVIRALRVCEENIENIMEAVQEVPGCRFQSYSDGILLVNLPGFDMLKVREGDYIRIAARKLEGQSKESFEENYELRIAKKDIVKRLEVLEEK